MDQTEFDQCIRCGEAPCVDGSEFCGHCYWAVRAEIPEGMYALRTYLAGWTAFRQWEAGGA